MERQRFGIVAGQRLAGGRASQSDLDRLPRLAFAPAQAAPRGDTQWARNLRAAGLSAAHRRRARPD